MSEIEYDRTSLPRQPGIDDLKVNRQPSLCAFDQDRPTQSEANPTRSCQPVGNDCPESEFILN